MRFLLFTIFLMPVLWINPLSSQNATEELFTKSLENNLHITKGKLIAKGTELFGCPVARLQLEYSLTENKSERCFDGQFLLKWIRKPDTDINCPFRATDFLPFCIQLRVADPSDPSKTYDFVIQDDDFVLKPMLNEFAFQFKYRQKNWQDGVRIIDFSIYSEQQKFLEKYRFNHSLFSAVFYPETPMVLDYRDNMDIISATLTTGTYLDKEKGAHNTLYSKKVSFSPRIAVFRSGEKDLNDFIKKHQDVSLFLTRPLLDGKEYISEDLVWNTKKCRDIYTTINPGEGKRQFMYHRFVELGNGNYLIIQILFRYIKDSDLGPDKKSGLAFLKDDMMLFSYFFDSFDFE